MTRLALALATVGGIGYAPVAPGTFGSAIGAAIYLATRAWSPAAHVLVFAAVVVVGLWASHRAAT